MNDSLFWERFHGGATHFPLALVLVSALFDGVAWLRPGRPVAPDLRVAGRWLLILGAAGSLGAVASGLALSHGVVGGSGTLLRHHLFVWPAFALIAGLAAWRLVMQERGSRRAVTIYLAVMALVCVLLLAASFFGGEMLLGK